MYRLPEINMKQWTRDACKGLAVVTLVSAVAVVALWVCLTRKG